MCNPFGVTCALVRTLPTSPRGGAGGSGQNLDMPKRKILEVADQSDRAKMCRELGTLKDLAVQPATKRRYDKAAEGFFTLLKQENLVLPTRKDRLDPLLCEYLEHLWATGVGRGQANDTVAALQHLQPSLRGHLAGAWRLLKTWAINEIPNRAPPIPEQVVRAVAGWAFFHGHYTFGVLIVLGFYCMLRSGELMGLNSSHMCSLKEKQALISLGMTKGGKRQGAAESVVLGVESAFRLIHYWQRSAPAGTPFCTNPSKWRSLFNESLEAMNLSKFHFRPYSLRRGGATLAMLARTQIDFKHPDVLSFLQIFHHTVKRPNFSTVEPPVKTGRSGGRGIKAKERVRKRVQKCAFVCPRLTIISVCQTARRFGSAVLATRKSSVLSNTGFGRVVRGSLRKGPANS